MEAITTSVITLIFSAGVAWGTASYGIKSHARRLTAIERNHEILKDQVTDRLARIETKLDLLLRK